MTSVNRYQNNAVYYVGSEPKIIRQYVDRQGRSYYRPIASAVSVELAYQIVDGLNLREKRDVQDD